MTDLEAEVYNPRQDERELENLMRYLNPNERQLDDAEIIHAAKLVALCEQSPRFCELQVRTAFRITAGKFRDRYQHWYNLTGATDTVCTAIADIHHQARGTLARLFDIEAPISGSGWWNPPKPKPAQKSARKRSASQKLSRKPN